MIALFWVVMNALLWRSEFGEKNRLASPIPISVVWQKILTAPDDSTVEITYQGKKVGYCRWLANTGEGLATGKSATDEYSPEGQVKQVDGYTVDVEGNLIVGEKAEPEAHSLPRHRRDVSRLRFEFHGKFATNHVWQEFTARALLRPYSWEVQARAADGKIRVSIDDGESVTQRTLPFADLKNPIKLLSEFGLDLPPLLLAPLMGSRSPSAPSPNLGLDWKSETGWLKLGHSQVRIYRLHARLLDKYEANIIISRVGEILKAEFPLGVLLQNDALLNL